MSRSLSFSPIENSDERAWCARLLSSTDPWITLRRGFDACHELLGNAGKERYVIRDGGERVGVLVIDMRGTFSGYIQIICLAPEARGRGIGARAIAWAEERIFRDSRNVFMCVSSFNAAAQRLYERLGFKVVGVLDGLVVDEHDEILLRKRRPF
jgi:ribosomal protein S18 acetylase RimI-like enzyme